MLECKQCSRKDLSEFDNLSEFAPKDQNLSISEQKYIRVLKVSEFYHSLILSQNLSYNSPESTPPDLMFQNRGIYNIFHIFITSSLFPFSY